MTHLFRIGNIENVLFEKSARARRMNITVRPFKGVRVAVPHGVSFKDARDFAESNLHWIQRQLEKAARAEKKYGTFSDPFKNIDRRHAREILIQRLAELARIHGYRYNRVAIRNQKTRWGSCSAKNNINLNIKLTRLPRYLMDYVILHELVHTRIKNHGPRFYAELDRLISHQKKLDRIEIDRVKMDRALKTYGVGLL